MRGSTLHPKRMSSDRATADGAVERRATAFAEDAAGYQQVLALLGDSLRSADRHGGDWSLLEEPVRGIDHRRSSGRLLNPLRTHRFASEDLQRTKTDAIDAIGIARFAAQKKPTPALLPDAATEELRELVRLRQRLLQDFGDRVRQLHRLVDLGFPEFTRYVRSLDSELASAILQDYPTAEAFRGVAVKRLAALRYDGRHQVGLDLARTLLDAARRSVGYHHSAAYRLQVRYACQDLDLLRHRLRELDHDIDGKLREHEVGRLLTTIDGIGPQTAARVIGEVGDPAHFRSASAFPAYVAPSQVSNNRANGKLTVLASPPSAMPSCAPPCGCLRSPPFVITHGCAPTTRTLRARGKLPKVALVACMHKLLLAIYSVAKHRRPFVAKLPTQTAST